MIEISEELLQSAYRPGQRRCLDRAMATGQEATNPPGLERSRLRIAKPLNETLNLALVRSTRMARERSFRAEMLHPVIQSFTHAHSVPPVAGCEYARKYAFGLGKG